MNISENLKQEKTIAKIHKAILKNELIKKLHYKNSELNILKTYPTHKPFPYLTTEYETICQAEGGKWLSILTSQTLFFPVKVNLVRPVSEDCIQSKVLPILEERTKVQ